MNFTCHGVITGYTAALREQTGEQAHPIILQFWRKNLSQPDTYYKTNTELEIEESLCMDGLNEVYMLGEVSRCILDRNNVVSVQHGDILGLKSLDRSAGDIMLGFAKASSGPTNYMVENEVFFSLATTSSRDSVISSELPQITLEIKSSGKIKYILDVV
jgi:hypothetical protein